VTPSPTPGLALTRLSAADHPRLAEWIASHNRRDDGRARCLHADHGLSSAEHLRELQSLAPDESLFLAAVDGEGSWLGVVGCEHDAVAARAWVRGPLPACGPGAAVAGMSPACSALAVGLLQGLARHLPAIRQFDGFVQTDEPALLQCWAALGAERRSDYHVMRAGPEAAPAAWPEGVLDATPALAEAAADLHGQSFPASYLSPQALLEERDADRRLLVASAGGQLAGYLYAQHKRGDDEGYVDFLAVAPGQRGRGHGRRLLAAALHWTLAERRLPATFLTVESVRQPALGLYQASGFVRQASGAHLRWTPALADHAAAASRSS
jgi:ribosomal protein S18 acetylase RimI-like enzyme